jgi:putative endonuclease
MTGAYLYILRCADGSYYTGTARKGLELRVAEHNAGCGGDFTMQRRPVTLVLAEHFETVTDAIAMERRVVTGKKRSVDRKRLEAIANSGATPAASSFETRSFAALLRMRMEQRS